MLKLPTSIVCPFCKGEIHLEGDAKGMLRTNELLSMRIRTPIYIHAGKTAEVSLDMSVCTKCNTIVGITRKAM